MQHHDGHIEQEKPDQERFDRGEMLGPVILRPPGQAHAKGEDETDQVERAPMPQPGNGEHRQIEYGIKREQGDMAATAGRQQHRGQIVTQKTQNRQSHGILQYRQGCGTGHQYQHQGKGDARRQQVIQPIGSKDRQQQDADTAALQAQAKGRAHATVVPAPEDDAQASGGNHRQAQGDRRMQPAGIDGIFERGRNPEQQHQQTDLDRHVAGKQGLTQARQDAPDGVRFVRLGRLIDGLDACRHGCRCRSPRRFRNCRLQRFHRVHGHGFLVRWFGLGACRRHHGRRNHVGFRWCCRFRCIGLNQRSRLRFRSGDLHAPAHPVLFQLVQTLAQFGHARPLPPQRSAQTQPQQCLAATTQCQSQQGTYHRHEPLHVHPVSLRADGRQYAASTALELNRVIDLP